MNQYDYRAISTQQLAAMMQAISVELARRLSVPEQTATSAPAEAPAPATPFVAEAQPTSDEKDYALNIKEILREGGYIKAAERQFIAELAERCPEWVTRQGLPVSSSAGEWERKRQYMSAPRAKERTSRRR